MVMVDLLWVVCLIQLVRGSGEIILSKYVDQMSAFLPTYLSSSNAYKNWLLEEKLPI